MSQASHPASSSSDEFYYNTSTVEDAIQFEERQAYFEESNVNFS